ncbi:hypothetical protein PWT90_05911 [Aphanocladium album]|nr:hypothetical protein PWT90_05911 [Aphanocladium album]
MSVHWSSEFSSLPDKLYDLNSTRYFAVGFILVVAIWRFVVAFHSSDPREPPVVRPVVPFVGHLWGLMRHAHDYLNSLHRQNGLPICTLPMLGRKVYVINSPSLVQAAFANPNLSFGPFVKDFVARMDELSPAARKAYSEEGIHSSVMQIFSTYMTGTPLKRMKAVMLKELIQTLPESGPGLELDSLWIWLRNALSVGTTSMLLGQKHNPFKDMALVEAYWKFEGGDPSRRFNVTAVADRGSAEGHGAILKALTAYFTAGRDLEDEDIAEMTREVTQMQRKHGFNNQDLAASQVVIILGSLVSAVPTVFWLVVNVFSSPRLLEKLREEALAAVTMNGNQVLVTADRIEPLCPTLLAVFRETQRLSAVGTLHRRVLNDTDISGIVGGERKHYLLKKGVAVLIPVKPSHRNIEAWAGEVDEFDPERFYVSSNQKAVANTRQARKKAYFPFGGGRELCPGRNFATAEALGTLVVLVLGFDISGLDGSVLKSPPVGASKMTSQTARPLETADLRARLKRRVGWEDVVWGVSTD